MFLFHSHLTLGQLTTHAFLFCSRALLALVSLRPCYPLPGDGRQGADVYPRNHARRCRPLREVRGDAARKRKVEPFHRMPRGTNGNHHPQGWLGTGTYETATRRVTRVLLLLPGCCYYRWSLVLLVLALAVVVLLVRCLVTLRCRSIEYSTLVVMWGIEHVRLP